MQRRSAGLLRRRQTRPRRGKGNEMVGMVLSQQPLDSMVVAIPDDRSASQDGVGVPSPGSEGSCSSCGACIEHDAALCPWCGRAALKDAIFDSEGTSTWR